MSGSEVPPADKPTDKPSDKPTDKKVCFDALLVARERPNPWSADGGFTPDIDLLRRLVVEAMGSDQKSGLIAGGLDLWVADELRRAGFPADDVWPRAEFPRVMPRDVRLFVDHALTSELREKVVERFPRPGARKALPAEAHVVGRAFRKQADVLIASWEAGLELMVSTKTMLSSYQKNLRNRFEEGYGDAKNLRGRHPLAALGFLFAVGGDIPPVALDFAIDMLRKLTAEGDVYDRACLLVIDGLGDGASAEAEAGADAPRGLFEATELSIASAVVPDDLGPAAFFGGLCEAALDRMPFEAYPGVRALQQAARG